MPGTFGQVRHILFPYFNCMIPTNAGLVAGNAYLVTIQLYQNTGRFRKSVKMDWNGKTLKKDKRESQNFIKLRRYDSVNLGQIV